MSKDPRNQDRPGGGPGEARNIERYGTALAQLGRIASMRWSGDYELTGLKVRLGVVDHFDTMVIITARHIEGAYLVAFHSANMPEEAVAGAINRFLNGSLKWRDDEYATGRARQDGQDEG